MIRSYSRDLPSRPASTDSARAISSREERGERCLREADPDGVAEFEGQRVADRLGDLGHALGAGGVVVSQGADLHLGLGCGAPGQASAGRGRPRRRRRSRATELQA